MFEELMGSKYLFLMFALNTGVFVHWLYRRFVVFKNDSSMNLVYQNLSSSGFLLAGLYLYSIGAKTFGSVTISPLAIVGFFLIMTAVDLKRANEQSN